MLLALGGALSTPMERVLEPSNASPGPCQPCRFLKCPPLYDVHEDAELCQCECKLAQARMEAKRIKKPCLDMKRLAANATHWDYYRVPKSGSTAMEAPLKACEAIRYHGHGDGCFESPDVCDASLLPDSRASFVNCLAASPVIVSSRSLITCTNAEKRSGCSGRRRTPRHRTRFFPISNLYSRAVRTITAELLASRRISATCRCRNTA